MNRRLANICILLTMLMLSAISVRAEYRPYHYEVGLQGGVGYYVGDATEHIFQNVMEAYGVQFRYKFDERWSLQLKGAAQRIQGPLANEWGYPAPEKGKWVNQMVNVDVMAEFNFFRFGKKKYDRKVKPFTPYIFLGIGCGIHSDFSKATAYFPVGVGLKWKFADFVGLNFAWQHNVYFGDNLENTMEYNNIHALNGNNIMNCDLTGMMTLGLVFEFGKEKKVCRFCDNQDLPKPKRKKLK